MSEKGKWIDFIEEYRSIPQLWDIHSLEYKNKNERCKGYKQLLIEFRKIDPDANMDSLKKKIANMRTCYRRELKKILDSERCGEDGDDIYVPNLWYFEYLDFLRDLEMPTPTTRKSLIPAKYEVEDEDEDEEDVVEIQPRKLFKKQSSDVVDTRRELRRGTTHRFRDDATIFAEGWACMFRKMTEEQQLFAKQAVDEIMLLGRYEKLFFNYINSVSDVVSYEN